MSSNLRGVKPIFTRGFEMDYTLGLKIKFVVKPFKRMVISILRIISPNAIKVK